MARPTKQGVDYFPLDTSMDMDISLFIADTGASGFGVLIATWQLIYKENGYYIDYSDDLFLMIRRLLMIDISEAKSIIDKAIERGIFDKSKYEKHQILTSAGIQKRYIIASKKKKIVIVDGNYLCNGVSGGGNMSIVESNGISGGGNATKEKVKEKVNVNTKQFNEFWNLYPKRNGKKVGKLKRRSWKWSRANRK